TLAVLGIMSTQWPRLAYIALGIIALFGVIFAYLKWYYANSYIEYGKTYVFQRCGVIFESFGYTTYDALKDTKTIQYPFTDVGTLKLDIAGEILVGSGKNQQLLSNSFDIHYVENISLKDDFQDLVMEYGIQKALAKPVVEQPRLITCTESFAVNLVPVIIVCIVIFPLLLVLPFILAILAWHVSTRSYWIEQDRVVMRSGIFFVSQTSILFEKMDFIQTKENFIDKMFGTGSVVINTVGSSAPEFVLKNVKNYQEFHALVKKLYEEQK
ncbi:MAG TPA: PH domain-containing protein, partial [Acidobacteriota bacterium]|nr:PH domain-containing protein [Acidobacteriota bacterium]